MKKKSKNFIKVGDKVKIISGFHKNESGKVLEVNRKTGKLVVEKINFRFKHIKSTKENGVNEIKKFEAPIHHSNVKLNLEKIS